MGVNQWVLVVLSGGAVALIIYAWCSDHERLRKKRLSFLDRASLDPRQIFAAYYGGTDVMEDQFLRYWIEIARLLRLDPQRLRPTDRFDNELGPLPGKELCDEIEDVADYCEVETGMTPPRSLETLDDVIRWLVKFRREDPRPEAEA